MRSFRRRHVRRKVLFWLFRKRRSRIIFRNLRALLVRLHSTRWLRRRGVRTLVWPLRFPRAQPSGSLPFMNGSLDRRFISVSLVPRLRDKRRAVVNSQGFVSSRSSRNTLGGDRFVGGVASHFNQRLDGHLAESLYGFFLVRRLRNFFGRLCFNISRRLRKSFLGRK